ncbi:hypothetical protein Cni_G20294 [Canna indica]|uniref:Uncharacterized protein n=1 Tax=Canna indica TaxID=4628 RepID=A0AAQ3KSY7_9LILI|nr:hypothetical protein Cni_G20294 [Canna indica]
MYMLRCHFVLRHRSRSSLRPGVGDDLPPWFLQPQEEHHLVGSANSAKSCISLRLFVLNSLSGAVMAFNVHYWLNKIHLVQWKHMHYFSSNYQHLPEFFQEQNLWKESFFNYEDLSSMETEEKQVDGSSTSMVPVNLGKEFSDWRLVESIGICHQFDSGGSFVLHGKDHIPLLARAFPVVGKSYLLVEAVALRQAVKAMVELGEEKLLFCCSCKLLLQGLHGKLPDYVNDSVEEIINEIKDLALLIPKVRVIYRPKVVMWWVLNLAILGTHCQQHIQLDRPMMQGMGLI